MTDYELFRAITLHVCGTLDLSAALRNVFDILKDLLPLDEIRINIFDTDLHAVKTIIAVDNEKTQNLLSNPLVIPLPPHIEKTLRGDTLEDIRIVARIDEDRVTAAVRDEFFAEEPESSMLIMRLFLDNERQGVLLLRAVGENRYTNEHKNLMARLNEPFAIALNNAIAHHKIEQLKNSLAEDNRELYSELKAELKAGTEEIIGASFGLSPVMDLVRKVANLDSTVLLLGETGVGKEVVANAIHNDSPRKNGPFIKVNCGAIPNTLIDSELFGHEKGSFTGAIARKKGRFERAHGGTLFLDEIGELPPDVQVRLLRVLQTKTLERVGGDGAIETDARIIAATHRDLEQLVAEGKFRKDLWYRINMFPITIPPLRDRRVDIPALVNHFIEKKSSEMAIQPPSLEKGAMERLRNYSWPGNVRELENTIERALILSRSGPLCFDRLDNVPRPESHDEPDPEAPPPTLETVVTEHIKKTLQYTDGKVGGPEGAAALLGVNPSTLRHRMRKLGISFGRQ